MRNQLISRENRPDDIGDGLVM